MWRKLKDDSVRHTLLGTSHVIYVPVLDSYMQKLSGTPSQFERVISERIVSIVRNITNTKSFELLITGLVNSSSRLRQSLGKHNA